jgi:hypothetical protein
MDIYHRVVDKGITTQEIKREVLDNVGAEALLIFYYWLGVTAKKRKGSTMPVTIPTVEETAQFWGMTDATIMRIEAALIDENYLRIHIDNNAVQTAYKQSNKSVCMTTYYFGRKCISDIK